MAQLTHETKVVSNSVVSPATTRASMEAFGCVYVLVTTTQGIMFTIDGATDPVITGGAEVGSPLTSSEKLMLTIDEFLALKMIRTSGTDARVQFEFMNEKFRAGPWQS